MNEQLLVNRLEINLNYIESCLIGEAEDTTHKHAPFVHKKLVFISNEIYDLQIFLKNFIGENNG